MPVLAEEHVKPVQYYGENRKMISPPLATPAILSFLSLNTVVHGATRFPGSIPLTALPTVSYASREWDGEWERCHSLSRSVLDSTLTQSFRPGSIEGMWEGMFTVNSDPTFLAFTNHAFYRIVPSTQSSPRTPRCSLEHRRES